MLAVIELLVTTELEACKNNLERISVWDQFILITKVFTTSWVCSEGLTVSNFLSIL